MPAPAREAVERSARFDQAREPLVFTDLAAAATGEAPWHEVRNDGRGA